MPRISVIMGVFNTEKDYIVSAIDSILNQSFSDFEFIICNDACTDDTFSFIQEKYHDKRIVWLENAENKGLAYTLNHCLSVAKGEYIARMDTDDISLKNRFEKQIECFEKNKNVGVVNCNINVFDKNGIYGERKYNTNIEIKDFLLSNPIVHPAVMVKKSCYDLVDNYRDIDITYRNEDYDLFLRMKKENVEMITVQEKLFNFREDKNSYLRRKYKYRINEYKVKYDNFKKMGLLPKYYLYCVKPLIIGLMPTTFLKMFRNKG